MTPPLIRQGEGAAGLHRIHQARQLERAQLERRINDALNNPDLDAKIITRATAGGDERKLRGIPAIGRGVTGAIPGTSPHRIRA